MLEVRNVRNAVVFAFCYLLRFPLSCVVAMLPWEHLRVEFLSLFCVLWLSNIIM